MAKLTYLGLISLDGYLADADGNFDWAAPDADVHRFVNDLVRPVGTYLYGRRMYDVMQSWETAHTKPGHTDYSLDFAQIWQAADKIVYSSTLPAVSTAKTRLERQFDPDAVRQLKTTADRDLSIGGAGIASHAIAAGLVDEWQLFLTPVIVGGGTPFLPDGVRVNLELLDERRFANGVVFLRYHTT
jgi:dihydrofolate reductase